VTVTLYFCANPFQFQHFDQVRGRNIKQVRQLSVGFWKEWLPLYFVSILNYTFEWCALCGLTFEIYLKLAICFNTITMCMHVIKMLHVWFWAYLWMCVCVHWGWFRAVLVSAAATGFCTVNVMEWKMHSAALYSTQLHHQRELSTFICFSDTHMNFTTCPQMNWQPMHWYVCSTCISSRNMNKLTQSILISARWHLASFTRKLNQLNI